MVRSFRYENVRLDYKLELEERKTISATVYPNQSVSIKAPLASEPSRINEFLTRKWRWILKQRRYFAQFSAPAVREYVSGETFLYLGRRYKLLVRPSSHEERVSLHHGTLIIYSNNPKNRKRTQDLLESWQLQRATLVFDDRLKVCFEKFNHQECPSLQIRKLKKRWGSYLPKSHRIHLNVDLIQASKAQIDYVITHELCHITHLRHNREFYELLKGKCPNWEAIKEALELRLGAQKAGRSTN